MSQAGPSSSIAPPDRTLAIAPAHDDGHTADDIDAALSAAAVAVLGGDPSDASARLHSALAQDDARTFSRVAAALAKQAPFDGAFVARALSRLHAEVAEQIRAIDARLRTENRHLAQIARRDSLTGIANRGTLDESLAMELRRAQRYGHAFSVLFVDVDHFKAVNDTHGHLVGDRVLRALVSTLGASLRPGDVLGRYGGEEFIIGLVNADGRAALRTAERLRRDVERATIDLGHRSIHITVSIGVATMRAGEPATLRALVDRADRAMLDAKANGRNAVCASIPPPPPPPPPPEP